MSKRKVVYTIDAVQHLWDRLQNVDRLTQLSNKALADLLVEQLWAPMPLGSPQSDLLAEAIARLKGETNGSETL